MLNLEVRDLKSRVTELDASLQAEHSARVGMARLLITLTLHVRHITQHASLARDASVDLQRRLQDVENAIGTTRRSAQSLATEATSPASLELLRPGPPTEELNAFRAILKDLTEPP